MTTEELQRLYDEIRVDAEIERRVIAAVTTRNSGTSMRRWVAAVAAAAVVAVLAIVIAVRPGGHSATPPAHSTPPQPAPSDIIQTPPQVIIPAPRPDVIDGAILDDGRPMSGATLIFLVWPNSSVNLKRGQPVHEYQLGTAVTDEHGAFVLPVSVAKVPDKYIEGDRADGAAINIEVNVASRDPGRGSSYFFPVETTPSQHSKKSQIVFDLGRYTVRIDGQTHSLPR